MDSWSTGKNFFGFFIINIYSIYNLFFWVLIYVGPLSQRPPPFKIHFATVTVDA